MKNIMTLIIGFILVSCNQFKGELNVSDHLHFIKNNKNDYLIEGDYSSKVKIKKSKIIIKAKNKFQKTKITLKVPNNFDLPTLSLKKIHKAAQESCLSKNKCDGDFTFKLDSIYLDESDTGQPFNTTALILVHRQKSDIIKGTETCAVLPNLQECQLNEHWRNNYSMCRNGIPGIRNVTYRKYHYDLELDIYLKQDDRKKATFTSGKKASYIEYLSTGPCIIN